MFAECSYATCLSQESSAVPTIRRSTIPSLFALLLLAGSCAASYDSPAPSYGYDSSVPSYGEVVSTASVGSAGLSETRKKRSGELDRKFVRTARLTMEVDDEEDFRPVLEKAQALTRKFEGYVAALDGAQYHDDGPHRAARQLP